MYLQLPVTSAQDDADHQSWGRDLNVQYLIVTHQEGRGRHSGPLLFYASSLLLLDLPSAV